MRAALHWIDAKRDGHVTQALEACADGVSSSRRMP
jgi:hypothetical protein